MVGLIALATMLLLFSDAFALGVSQLMIERVTSLFMGEAILVHKDYDEDSGLEKLIVDPESVLEGLQKTTGIRVVAPRMNHSAMASSAASAASVQLVGVDFEAERRFSDLATKMVHGKFPAGVGTEQSVVMGHRLAQNLEVELGDKIIITSAAITSGELSQELFRIRAVMKTGARELDESLILADMRTVQRMMGAGRALHKVAMKFDEARYATDPTFQKSLQSQLDRHSLEVRAWPQLVPSLAAMVGMNQYSMTIMAVILGLIVSLALVNSIFMTIYERLFEYGVMLSLGTRRLQLALMITSESILLGLFGCASGLLLSIGLLSWLVQYGIPVGEMEISGIQLSEPIRGVLRPMPFMVVPVIIMGVCVLSSLYPAAHLARMKPMDAVRKGS